jgi:hypothetical protein
MIKWLITTVLALVLFSGLSRLLSRFGFGRLPGDFSIQLRGREWPMPLGSTLLLSALAAVIAHLI